jgi:hypothetical protein
VESGTPGAPRGRASRDSLRHPPSRWHAPRQRAAPEQMPRSPPRLSRSGAHRVACPVAYVPTVRPLRTACLPVALMPVANVPTTWLLGPVEVRVDARSSACASRRGDRTRRADARSAPGRGEEMTSNLPRALVGGCSALRGSWDRLSPATTVEGSSVRGSSISLVSGRIGGFPFASLPLEGLKRRDPHRGRYARRSKSAVMPISSLWRIDTGTGDSPRVPRQGRRGASRERPPGLRSRRRCSTAQHTARRPWGRVEPTVGSCAHTRGTRASARFLECVTTRWHRLLPSLRFPNT